MHEVFAYTHEVFTYARGVYILGAILVVFKLPRYKSIRIVRRNVVHYFNRPHGGYRGARAGGGFVLPFQEI